MNRAEFIKSAQAARLTEEVKRDQRPVVKAACAWCGNLAAGNPDIPRPSQEQCAAHTELNHEWTRRLRTLPESDDGQLAGLREEIYRRGREIAARVNQPTSDTQEG